MSVSSNALLRHITIDACLRDASRKYTLLDLIEACTDAIKENSKIKLKDHFVVSTRTVQLDLQFMRDKKRGYNAPIVVYEQKYYKYKDPAYSIGNANVKQTNLEPLSDIAETLLRYTRIDGMESLKGSVELIQEVIDTKVNGGSKLIAYQPEMNPSGGQFFDIVKDATIHRKVLSLNCTEALSSAAEQVIFYPLYMKEYLSRWYVVGYEDGKEGYHVIPLESISSYSYAILPFPPNYSFDSDGYFKNIIGVTKPAGTLKQEITLRVGSALVPFVTLNPLHSSQKLVSKEENGDCVYKISVIPNEEFYRLVFENQPNVAIISPKSTGVAANEKMRDIMKELPRYEEEQAKPKKEPKKKKEPKNEPDLFGGLF